MNFGNRKERKDKEPRGRRDFDRDGKPYNKGGKRFDRKQDKRFEKNTRKGGKKTYGKNFEDE